MLKHWNGKFYEVQQFGCYRVDAVEVIQPETGALHQVQYFALHLPKQTPILRKKKEEDVTNNHSHLDI